jgi:hypothetical protein
MKEIERRRFEMFVRVRDFGATHGAAFAANSRGAELFAALGGIVEELQGHAAVQSSGTSAGAQGTASRSALRDELHKELQAISRTARVMSPDAVGLKERFRIPSDNLNDQQLLTTARAFAAAAAPLKDEFIRNEMPTTFLEQLAASIAAFESAITDQNRNRDARVSATESIDAAIDRGIETIRQLDALVRNKFRDDSATLAAWTSASHTESASRAAAKPDTKPA